MPRLVEPDTFGNGTEQNALLEWRENGRIVEGDLRLGENGELVIYSGSELVVKPDDTVQYTVYEEGKMVAIQYRGLGTNLDYFTQDGSALIFSEEGALMNGTIENIDTGVQHKIVNGRIVQSIQDVPVIRRLEDGTITQSKEDASLIVDYDTQGNVVSSRLTLDSDAVIELDEETLKNLTQQVGEMLVMLDEQGQPVVAFDGKRIFLGLNAQEALQAAIERFQTVPYGIDMPTGDEVSDAMFEGNLELQYLDVANFDVLTATQNAITQAQENNPVPLRQIINEQTFTNPSSLIEGVSATTTIQHSLLYEGAAEANEYIEAKFLGGASLIITDEAQIGSSSAFNFIETEIALGSTDSAVRQGIVGHFTDDFQGETVHLDLGFSISLESGTPAINFSTSIQAGAQLFEVSTSVEPTGLPPTSGSQTLDTIKNDFLDRTLQTLQAIQTSQPLPSDAILAPDLLIELMTQDLGNSLDPNFVQSMGTNFKLLLSDLATENNIELVDLEEMVV